MIAPHTFADRAGRPVWVRCAREDDAEAIIAYVQAVDTESTFLSREPGEFTMSVASERLFLRQMADRDNALYLLALDEGAIVGMIDFHGGTRQRIRHAGEFGMSVRKSHWGRGIGTHLLDAMLAWARETEVVHKVKLRVHAGNERAIALYRSRGFETEGVLRREMRIDGEWIDLLCLALWLDGLETPILHDP